MAVRVWEKVWVKALSFVNEVEVRPEVELRGVLGGAVALQWEKDSGLCGQGRVLVMRLEPLWSLSFAESLATPLRCGDHN